MSGFNSYPGFMSSGSGGGGGGAYIPLAGTDSGAPVTGPIAVTDQMRLYFEDSCEITLSGGVGMYAPPFNNIRTYAIGSGTYQQPDSQALFAQNGERNYIFARSEVFNREALITIEPGKMFFTTNTSSGVTENDFFGFYINDDLNGANYFMGADGLGIGTNTQTTNAIGFLKTDNLPFGTQFTYQLPSSDGDVPVITGSAAGSPVTNGYVTATYGNTTVKLMTTP